jgi:archaellum component FlaC
MSARIKQMRNTLDTLSADYQNISNSLKITQGHLQVLKDDLSRCVHSIQGLSSQLRNDDLIKWIRNIDSDSITQIEKELNDVDQDINKLIEQVRQHRINYLDKLIKVQFQLS